MANTIERKVYINSLPEIENQTPAYRCATPAPGTDGIYTNDYNQSYEYTRSARAGSFCRVGFVSYVGALACRDVHDKGAGLRPALNLIHNPESPREARPVKNTVNVWDSKKEKYVKQQVVKHVLDIPQKDGKTVPMQIDNWDAIEAGMAETYQLKTLHSVKAQRFNPYKSGEVCNDYENSEIDQACTEFYQTLAPEIQQQIATVVMDKENNYEITGVKTAEKQVQQDNPTVESLFEKLGNDTISIEELRDGLRALNHATKSEAEVAALEISIRLCTKKYNEYKEYKEATEKAKVILANRQKALDSVIDDIWFRN